MIRKKRFSVYIDEATLSRCTDIAQYLGVSASGMFRMALRNELNLIEGNPEYEKFLQEYYATKKQGRD
ncbi:MAG: hypothetical protein V3U75_11185 [Methylococcaceae bacterium]